MQWTRAKRDAYVNEHIVQWCAEILAVAPADIALCKPRAAHRNRLSTFRVLVKPSQGPPTNIAFEVAFAPDKKRPRFSKVQIQTPETGNWEKTAAETDSDILETTSVRPKPPLLTVLLLTIILLAGGLAAIKSLKLTLTMVTGLRAYTWEYAQGTRDEGGYTYTYTVVDSSGKEQKIQSPFYDIHTRLRGGKEFGRDLLRYSWRLPEFEQSPFRVYVNPGQPGQAILKPGLPILLVYQLLALMIVLVPSFLAARVLRDALVHRKIEPGRFIPVAAAFGFYLLSFFGVSLLVPTWGYLLRTIPPAWPLLAWLLVSTCLFIFPRIAFLLYSYKFVRRGLYFLFFTGLLPMLLVAAGLSLPYVIAAIVAVMALIVLIKPLARVGHTPLYALLIALVWVPVYVSGLLAPSRALVQLLHEFMPYMPYNLSITGIENPRLMAGFDLFFGLAGISVSLLATYMDSIWRARQAAQVDILPTSRARSVAIGLVELAGRARHLTADTHGPILHYDSRSPAKNRKQPFYLEDETGQILIDPRKTRFRTPGRTSLGGRLTETVLKNREQLPDLTTPHIMTLESGDPIYVIGTAHVNPDAPSGAKGSDRLVIQRRKGSIFTDPLWRASQGKIKPAHRVEDILFITDSAEADARRRIMRGIWQVWAWALLWIALGLSLFNFQLPRSRPGYALWSLPEIIQYAPVSDRLEAVLTFIERETTRPARDESTLYRRIRSVPRLGPFLEKINRNMLQAQFSEGINFLWRQKFNAASRNDMRLLVKAAGATHNDVRHWAVSRMGHLTSHPDLALPILIKALASDPDITVRTTAASTLAAFKERAHPAIPALVEAAGSSHSKLRYRAIFTLSRLPEIPSGPARDYFINMVKDDAGWVRQAGVIGIRNLAHHSSQDADVLLKSASDRDHYVRSLAIGTLSSIRPQHPSFAQTVLQGLGDSEELVRQSAVRAAAVIEVLPEKAAAPLGRLITDPSVSSRVLSLLVAMGDRAAPAVPYLASALSHKDRKVVYNAAFALSRMGPAAADAAPELKAALTHSDKFVRRYSADALGAGGRAARGSLEALGKLKSDPDPYVRGAAHRAITRIHNAP